MTNSAAKRNTSFLPSESSQSNWGGRYTKTKLTKYILTFDAKIDEIGSKVAMHIAANKPEFMTIADVDPVAVEREKKVFIESGATAGKPENIVEKMVEGRIKKYYGESVLEEQPFVMDPSKTVKDVIAEANGKLAGFAFFVLGEGIEKREDNLADEVAKMLG